MGSFCVRCGVSGQTISDRDPCVYLPIVQESTFSPVRLLWGGDTLTTFGASNHSSGVSPYWAATGGFIFGTYEDCADMIPEDTPENRATVLAFLRTLVKWSPAIAPEPDSRHRNGFNIRTFLYDWSPRLQTVLTADRFDPTEPVLWGEVLEVWEVVSRAIYENRVFRLVSGGGFRPVKFMAIHRSAYDYLLKLSEGMPLFSGEVAHAESLLRKHIEVCRKTRDDEGEAMVFAEAANFREVVRMGLTSCEVTTALLSDTSPVHAILKHLAGALSFEDLLASVQPDFERVHVLRGMDAVGVALSPLVAIGQDYANSVGEAYSKMVSEVSATVSAKRSE